MSHGSEPQEIKGLPANARRPLSDGESYVPLVPQDGVPETTPRAITMGLVFCAIFSMAAAYLALKLGQGIEAAIPIAILAVGLSRFFPRKNTILENVIVQSIGANSSHVVSGAAFTIPALYILAQTPGSGVPTPTLWQVVLVSFLGGCIGILFLVPLRHHFMVENHGIFPWPEATATAEILVTGEKAGNQAKELAVAAGIGALYDGITSIFRGMGEYIRLEHVYVGKALREKFMSFNFLNSAATLGIGYIIGLRYSAVIAAGSFFSMFVLVPLFHAIGQHVPVIVPPGAKLIADMTPEQVFFAYVRIIGVGAIAGAGVMGVLASMPNMIRSIISNMKALMNRDAAAESPKAAIRTERSLAGSMIAVGLVTSMVGTLAFLSFGLGIKQALVPALIATLVVMVISFFFAPVAARAIATIGTNPISGMTMLTLVITGVLMLKLNFTGGYGMFLTMMVGGIVCTALAASGAFSTDLKIGHWIGATPARQIGWKFVGTFVAALFTGIAMWLMAKQVNLDGTMALGTSIPAPQASAMKAILEGIFGTVSMPLRWYAFGLGIMLSLVLRMVELPALGFALGMYLPIELNTPLFLGGILAHLVNRPKPGTSEADAKARENRGVLIASGLMAGGAIMGVVASFVKLKWTEGFPLLSVHQAEGALGEWLGLAALVALCLYVVVYSRRAKGEA
ncbi:OPT family oligopeptide transporter [Geothrix alkalitolerans]|uniref:OPT family oligopeptide transporter n=1 Tax=Geothrix alkalitolerans TaxID=2922724 RepID=UPI001FAFCB06|nr:oligopeptide transporter, OPT family [Geothrix alkalitolerans]